MSGPCYVYVMQAAFEDCEGRFPRHLIKLGIAEDPTKRLRQITTACPFKVTLFETWRFPDREFAAAIESEMHDCLARFRTNGEWFMVCRQGACESVVYSALARWVDALGNHVETVPWLLRYAGITDEEMIADYVAAQFGASSYNQAGVP